MSHTNFRLPPLSVAPAGRPMPPAPPWHPLDALRHQVERLYNDFAGGMWPVHAGPFPEDHIPLPLFRSLPLMDIQDKGDVYEVTVELPGLQLADITLTVTDGLFCIKGERRQPENDAKTFLLQERPRSAFERSFRLPEEVDSTNIEATFRDGLLNARLPKNLAARKTAQKIVVRT